MIIDEAVREIEDFGIIIPNSALIIDGEIHRVATRTSRGQKDAWYCFYQIGINGHIAGSYGEWRESGQTIKYHSWSNEVMTGDQRKQLMTVMQARNEQLEIKKEQKLKSCIADSITIWSSAKKKTLLIHTLKKRKSTHAAAPFMKINY